MLHIKLQREEAIIKPLKTIAPKIMVTLFFNLFLDTNGLLSLKEITVL